MAGIPPKCKRLQRRTKIMEETTYVQSSHACDILTAITQNIILSIVTPYNRYHEECKVIVRYHF
jgi:hypothetical protein